LILRWIYHRTQKNLRLDFAADGRNGFIPYTLPYAITSFVIYRGIAPEALFFLAIVLDIAYNNDYRGGCRMSENINDRGYRRILSDKRNFLDFVKNHVAAPWTGQINDDDLELIDGQFVTKDFRDKETDIVYKAKIDGRNIVFYVLLEMQSKPDFTMPFRLLVYMTELMRRLFAEAEENVRERKNFRLPAVIPIVLYNGTQKWSCVRSFKEYLAGYELFAPNIIDFEYIMINMDFHGNIPS
jgi:hypothetical protein